MKALEAIEMLAGHDAQGQPIIERIHVRVDEQNYCQLVKSPAFVQGLASGDTIKLDPQTEQFEIHKRSGNLCVRVYCKGDTLALSEALTPHLEKLGGELDIETPRMLVYSIHASCGFQTIEALLEQYLDHHCTWRYGNVYHPEDGTPLNWWQDILKPQ